MELPAISTWNLLGARAYTLINAMIVCGKVRTSVAKSPALLLAASEWILGIDSQ